MRTVDGPPEATKRGQSLPGPLRRDPDLPRLALVAAAAGLVCGAIGYAVGSSRGLDLIELHDLLQSAALVVVVAGIVLGAARIAMFQDWRVLALTVAVAISLPIGYQLSYVWLPGNTTDGQMIVDLPPTGPTETIAVSHPGKCTWDDGGASVSAVDSRRSAVRFPAIGQARMTAHVELVPGRRDATLSILVQPPLGGEPVFRYAGIGEVSLSDPIGRVGRVVVQGLVRQSIASEPMDSDVAAVMELDGPADHRRCCLVDVPVTAVARRVGPARLRRTSRDTFRKEVERETGFEPATSCLEGRRVPCRPVSASTCF
jgi:hypothetical protein